MTTPPRPTLLTFDIFGTVLDWRRGLVESLARRGVVLDDFDRVIDVQGRLEQACMVDPPFRRYADITAASLREALDLDAAAALAIGAEVGTWPLFPDSVRAMDRLGRAAPCVAMTNSDRAHGHAVRRSLGSPMAGWICAEELETYKPSPRFWEAVRDRRRVAFGPAWWHVSAYADYDLDVAKKLGLTTVLVDRPHARPGPADVRVADLTALADLLDA